MTNLAYAQERIVQRKTALFKNYLKERFDKIEKLPAVKIGCHEFGLSLGQAVRAYNSIEKFGV